MTRFLLARQPGDGPEKIQQAAQRRARETMATAGAATQTLSKTNARRMTADVLPPYWTPQQPIPVVVLEASDAVPPPLDAAPSYHGATNPS